MAVPILSKTQNIRNQTCSNSYPKCDIKYLLTLFPPKKSVRKYTPIMKFNPISVWKNIQELDLRPIRESAEQEVHLALVGAPGVGKRTLAGQLRADPRAVADSHAVPRREDTLTPILLADLEMGEQAASAHLIILLVDVNASDVSREQAFLDGWQQKNKNVLVFFNKLDTLPDKNAAIPWLEAGKTPKIYGSALDVHFLQTDFALALIRALPDMPLALGRRFPCLREPIARELIQQTCLTNVTYSVGTGLAEIIPVLDIPLNIADIVVLTKAQALLVYKLGLAFGLPKDWQYYLGEFGSVIGTGFLWRQIARSLVGLIPVWGIVPKVAVAYSGTYVVGHTVLAWYLTGRHISRKQLGEMSRQAFEQGKTMARNILKRAPKIKRPRLGWGKRKTPALPAGTEIELPSAGDPVSSDAVPAPEGVACPQCGTPNDSDAVFCKHCGERVEIKT